MREGLIRVLEQRIDTSALKRSHSSADTVNQQLDQTEQAIDVGIPLKSEEEEDAVVQPVLRRSSRHNASTTPVVNKEEHGMI